ncbi:MAG: hypothetical protein P8Y70_08790, partial [Candidatus Lokiarchaeota archaeon]
MRLSLGILIGVCFSFINVSLFNMWGTLYTAIMLLQQGIFRMLTTLVGANFNFNIIKIILSGPYSIDQILPPAFLGCIFIGFITGLCVKGIKRGILASFVVIVLVLLLWILFSIFSAVDLMSLFQGPELIETIGGIISASIGSILGGEIARELGYPEEIAKICEKHVLGGFDEEDIRK